MTDFPVDSYRDAAEHLRRPFAPPAVKWKVQTVFGEGSGCIIVAYIDARLVVERLNLVCPHLWSDEYETVGQGLLLCRLTVDGITRRDVGEGSGKALYSDALKRAAVKFGVGVSIYALPQVTIYWKDGEKRVKARPKGNKTTLELTDYGRDKFREGYGKWLAEHGEKHFGPALDHGDVEGAVGDPDAPDVSEPGQPDDGALPVLNDERAVELVARCQEAYKVFKRAHPRRLPPGQFNARVEAARTSHEALEALAVALEAGEVPS